MQLTFGYLRPAPRTMRPAQPALDVDPRSPATLIAVLGAGLCQTYGAVWLLCATPIAGTLTWSGLFRTAASFLLVAVLALLVAVWSNRWLFSRHVDASANLLLLAIWPAAAWTPLFVLLLRESSPWAALLPALGAASAARAVRRWTSHPTLHRPGQPSSVSTLFHVQRPPAFLRSLAPALCTSAALQLGTVAFALAQLRVAAVLFAVSVLLPRWETAAPILLPASPSRAAVLRSAWPRAVTVLLLLCVALLPYLRPSPLLQMADVLVRPAPSLSSAPVNPADHTDKTGTYSGIILIPPVKPKPAHPVVIPPPSTQAPGARKLATRILFDGVYWYFKQPDARPRPDAPIVHADPAQKSISSSNLLPLVMEAHQPLAIPIALSCCGSLLLNLRNADHTPGTIAVEILLRNTAAHPPTVESLGSRVLPSTLDPHPAPSRDPVDEVLPFSFPAHAVGRQFNEITVAIHPAPDRARKAPQLSIESFELVP